MVDDHKKTVSQKLLNTENELNFLQNKLNQCNIVYEKIK